MHHRAAATAGVPVLRARSVRVAARLTAYQAPLWSHKQQSNMARAFLGGPNSTRIHGTLVPVQEPSTALQAELLRPGMLCCVKKLRLILDPKELVTQIVAPGRTLSYLKQRTALAQNVLVDRTASSLPSKSEEWIW